MHTGLTITELADLTGMTARNIRAHQSRGLLGAPRILGRVAYYDAHHVARLELISSLQREGFTLGAIKHLLDSSGAYSAIVAERRRAIRDGSSDIRLEVPMGEALERMREIDPSMPERCIELGLLRRDGDEWLIPTTIAGIGRALVERGVPADLLSDIALEVAEHAHTVAKRLAAGLDDDDDRAGLLVIAVQLNAAVFETALEHATTRLHPREAAAERGSA